MKILTEFLLNVSHFLIRLAHVGGILNGTAGVCVCVIPSVISALWFPPGQRTTATGMYFFPYKWN